MTDIRMILELRGRGEPLEPTRRIMVTDEVADRFYALMNQPELQGYGSSHFIDRACEVAETAIAEKRARDRFREFVRNGTY